MTAAELMRSPIFVPESTKAMELFTRMERARQGMAVVVDEYGGAVGVVTMEDIPSKKSSADRGRGTMKHRSSLQPRKKDGSFRVKAHVDRPAQSRRDQGAGGELPESDDYESLAGLIRPPAPHSQAR